MLRDRIDRTTTWAGRFRPASAVAPVIGLLASVLVVVLVVVRFPDDADSRPARHVMLILRGVSDDEHPRGQLDDRSALEYARRLGYRGEVLDVAGNNWTGNPQLAMALDRIHADDSITALYGFSGGGYNARHLYAKLTPSERKRIRKIVVVGSPGVSRTDFPESPDVVIKPDPPTGHLEGPKALLDSLGG